MNSPAPHRICLLTPAHLSTNPRLVKEADALTAAGYVVSVIAANCTPWAQEADRSFVGRSWQVARTLSFGPYSPPVRRVVQVLRQHFARALLQIELWHPAVVRAAWHPIAPDLVQAALDATADLYIAHYPAALPAAAIAARHYGAQYAYDAEDFHLGDLPEGSKNDAQRDMVRAIEGRYLPGCAYTTAASPGIADAYAKSYGIPPPAVILNVFPKSEGVLGPSLRGSATPSPSVYWFSQTIGPDRGLECAVRAIGLSRTKPHIYLRGTPAKGFLDRLRTLAGEVKVAERIHILPPARPSQMAHLAAIYDLGLVGETGHTSSRQIGLTNKQFTYLMAGLPMVMSDISAHRDIAPELGKAAMLYPVDDPGGLAASLDAILEDKDALEEARKAAWQLARERFNWDIEQKRFLACLKNTFGFNASYRCAITKPIGLQSCVGIE